MAFTIKLNSIGWIRFDIIIEITIIIIIKLIRAKEKIRSTAYIRIKYYNIVTKTRWIDKIG